MSLSNAEITKLIEAAEDFLKQTTVGYKGHDGRWYSNPTTNWYKGLDKLSQAKAALVDTPTWPIPPQTPVTNISNPNGLGLNVNNQADKIYQDYIIDGTGNSGILLQGSTTRCKFARISLLNIAKYNAQPEAKHAIYCKARGNEFTDIYAENGGNCASSISVRMGNNSFTNTKLRGFNYVSYYEHDGQAGKVSFINGDWEFRSDTAFWGDDSNEPPSPYIKQEFYFENIDARGPGNKFLSFGASVSDSGGIAYQGAGITIKNCRLNGRPVTANDIYGVPSNLIKVI